VSGLVTGLAVVAAVAVGFVTLIVNAQLLGAVVVSAWLGLARALEVFDQALGRERGARAAYLLSSGTGFVGLVVLVGTQAVLGLSRAQSVWALVLSVLAVAAVTALGDAIPDRRFRLWAGWTAATVTGLAVLGAAAGSLGLLDPPKAWAAGTWYRPDGSLPRPSATAPLRPVPTATPSASPTRPTPTPTPTSVSARRPCRPGALTLAVGEFEAAMGTRTASVRASNRSESEPAPRHRDGPGPGEPRRASSSTRFLPRFLPRRLAAMRGAR
jgi:hypothetical protein